MSEVKKKLLGNEKRKKYRSVLRVAVSIPSDFADFEFTKDGTPIWEKRSIDGPGIWVSCVKGKEKQTIGELYDLLETLVEELWPETTAEAEEQGPMSTVEGLSLEAQIANEMSSLQKPRKQRRFASCQTNTPCVVFISCKPPIDPVQLVVKHIESVQLTGITHTRYTHRLVPVSDQSVASLPEIEKLCHSVFTKFLDAHEQKHFTFKVELRMRNHSTITRPALIQQVARCMPVGHTVSLDNPDLFILVEVFKGVCGVSVVKDYYRLQKFNVREIASKQRLDVPDDSRVPT